MLRNDTALLRSVIAALIDLARLFNNVLLWLKGQLSLLQLPFPCTSAQHGSVFKSVVSSLLIINLGAVGFEYSFFFVGMPTGMAGGLVNAL